MRLLRKSGERVRDVVVGHDIWVTFGPGAHRPFDRFGSLEVLREGRFERRAGRSEPRSNVEIITYVHAGALLFEDSLGLTGILRQGDFQRMTAGTGLQYSEVNASNEHEAHVFQFWLRPDRLGLEPGHEKRRFTSAERRGRLRLVASPDGSGGSLMIHQDAFLFSAVLAEGQHLVHPILANRGAWIHVVTGGLTVGDVTLKTGDGVGLMQEERASMLATEPTEILLLDLGSMESTRTADNGQSTPAHRQVKPGDNGSLQPRLPR